MLIIIFGFLILILVGIIVYLNTVSLINYNKGIKINILNTPPKCVNNNDNLGDSVKCQNSSDRYYSDNGIIYSLSTSPTQYNVVCNEICNNNLTDTGECKINSSQFDDCVKLLKPDDGCYNVANPIATDSESNIYYASSVLKSNC